MKKLLFFVLSIVSLGVSAQNIHFEQVGIAVSANSSDYVLGLLDDFYGSIEKPDGVSITLDYVYFKPEEVAATHYLTFAGSLEGLAKLREIRSGSAYQAMNSSIQKFAKVVSLQGGSTLMRMQVEKANQPIAQAWKFRVEDPMAFAAAFTKLTKGFPQEGYLSLGQFTHGTSSDGETHYVYTTHKDYETALGWGPKTQQQQEAFLNFQKKTGPISNFLGSMTLMHVKTW